MNNYIVSITTLLLFDFAWIGLYMKNKYVEQIKKIQKSPIKVKFIYGALAYALMILGLIIFVIPNIRDEHRFEDSLKYGFLFGIIVYGVYDFTAAAVLTNWDIKTAVYDMLWGGTVYFLAAYLGSFV